MSPTARVIQDCIGLLGQAAQLLTQVDDRRYIAVHPASPRGSIAGHLRHVIEFYQCFLAGRAHGQIDYNQRARDERIERSSTHAIEAIAKLVGQLRELLPVDGGARLSVALEGSSGPLVSWSTSSVLRELDYLQSHTVHHYALIAMLLRLQGIEPGADFGVAPSTLTYWTTEKACAA